ncbi:hypothetical protein [Xenorhabdus bovienii]|nr:hypothetical protein [Xenorhabdus bovienii]
MLNTNSSIIKYCGRVEDKPATKIPDEVLIADVQNCPDDYQSVITEGD